ncbi:unnamed protein product [marine sediment metagenome]|uniref:Uncharacterized protein n=1 Tax=marine sediment metagenome TaxID=412755 RepID=X0SKD3_9ZZZZ
MSSNGSDAIKPLDFKKEVRKIIRVLVFGTPEEVLITIVKTKHESIRETLKKRLKELL